MSPGTGNVDAGQSAPVEGAVGDFDRSRRAAVSLVRVRTQLTARLVVLVVGVLIAIAITSTGSRFDWALVAVIVVGTAFIAGALSWDRRAYSSPEPWTAEIETQPVRRMQPLELAVIAALYWVVMPIVALSDSKPHGAPFLAIGLGGAIATASNLRRAIRLERQLNVALYTRTRIFTDRGQTIWARPAITNVRTASPNNSFPDVS